MTARRWPWRLWGLANPRADAILTAVTAAFLAWTRFAFLARGPWEWDETLFARGMLHFELAAHFPHPPGFPGWLAIGHLLLPLAGEPLVALQWASAALSVFALWPLSVIGRRVAPPATATAAALLVLLLPGPWLYAERGFSSTAATAVALVAAALWSLGLDGRRATDFSVLVVVATLIRPILLPAFAVLWLLGAATVRPRRRLIPGVVAGAALVVTALAAMAYLEGGWDAMSHAFVVHAERHVSRLSENSGGIADLGLVKGCGGVVAFVVIAAASWWGAARWKRAAGRRAITAYVVILAVTIVPLLTLQNRTYARYAVPVQLGVAPLVAAAAASLPGPAGCAVLLVLAAASGAWSRPLLAEQHRNRLGAWEALLAAEKRVRDEDWALVVDPEVHPFASYRWHLAARRGEAMPAMELSPRAPEGWAGVDRPWVVAAVHPELYLPSLTGRERRFGRVSARLEPLTQQRFLSAEMIENPPLPVGQWWTRETAADGSSFMWAGAEAAAWLPPLPAETAIGVDLRPAPGDAPLVVAVDGGTRATVGGRSERTVVWLRTGSGDDSRPVIVRFERGSAYPPGGGDDRPLAVKVFGLIPRPTGAGLGGAAATDVDRARLRLELQGHYAGERFGDAGRGVWLTPAAEVRWEVGGPGRVRLDLRAPRPTDPHVAVTVAGRPVGGPVAFDRGAARVEFDLTEGDLEQGRAVFDVTSSPYVAADSGGGNDRRELGVVLMGVSFEPRPAGPVCWWNSGLEGEPQRY